jgi:hypothetical protein
MFYTDVAKVDQDVAYVAMVVHICCKSMSPMFHLFFKRMLQACLFECCICFHTYVASVLSGCCACFAMVFKYFLQVFQIHVSNILSVFLYVASVASECFQK